MRKPVFCKNCSVLGHYQYQCFRKKPKKINRPVIKKPSRGYPIDPQWKATKRKWFKANPPINGYYYCHYCSRVLVNDDTLNDFGVERVTLDHKVNRHNLELKYDITNLVACCARCNSLKGSRSYGSFCREFYPHLLK